MNDFWYVLRMNISQHAFEAAQPGEFGQTVSSKRTKKSNATPTQKSLPACVADALCLYRTTNYITGSANFDTYKDNFGTLSFQGLFESIVQNLTETTLAAVFLGFSNLSGTNLKIETPKRYDEHPRHFYSGVPATPGMVTALFSNFKRNRVSLTEPLL